LTEEELLSHLNRFSGSLTASDFPENGNGRKFIWHFMLVKYFGGLIFGLLKKIISGKYLILTYMKDFLMKKKVSK
jgi:hypothetical protein